MRNVDKQLIHYYGLLTDCLCTTIAYLYILFYTFLPNLTYINGYFIAILQICVSPLNRMKEKRLKTVLEQFASII